MKIVDKVAVRRANERRGMGMEVDYEGVVAWKGERKEREREARLGLLPLSLHPIQPPRNGSSGESEDASAEESPRLDATEKR